MIPMLFTWFLGNPGAKQEKEEREVAEANEFVNKMFADADAMGKMGNMPREYQEKDELDEMHQEARLFRFGFCRRN